jgi:SanA protein
MGLFKNYFCFATKLKLFIQRVSQKLKQFCYQPLSQLILNICYKQIIKILKNSQLLVSKDFIIFTIRMKKKNKHPFRRWMIIMANSMIALLLLPLIVLFISNQVIRVSSEGHLYESTDLIPYNKVGLVLGTSHRVRGGGPNPYFHNRMQAASELYHNGKVSYLLVSGDNLTRWYNEPEQMRKELLILGVPDSVIYLDFAGLRTLDSVIRCREVFGQSSFTVVSQRFHNQRAVYIARQNGIEAIALNARDAEQGNHPSILVREWFAKANVFIDILVNKQPRFLGEKIDIGEIIP